MKKCTNDVCSMIRVCGQRRIECWREEVGVLIAKILKAFEEWLQIQDRDAHDRDML